MCEIAEQASMRLRLVWAMAARLPMAIDRTDRMITHHLPVGANDQPSTSRTDDDGVKAASFGAEPMNIVTAVGAP